MSNGDDAMNTDSFSQMSRVLETAIGRYYRPARSEMQGGSYGVENTDPVARGDLVYNGWAPGSTDYDEESSPGTFFPPDPFSLERLGHSNAPARVPQRYSRELRAQSPVTNLERPQLRDPEADHLPEMDHPSLRNTAPPHSISVRRNAQFSSRWRNSVQQFLQDRERTGNEGDRDRPRLRRRDSLSSTNRLDRHLPEAQSREQPLSRREQQAVSRFELQLALQQAIRERDVVVHQQHHQHQQQQQQQRTAQIREFFRERIRASDSADLTVSASRPAEASQGYRRRRYPEEPADCPLAVSRSLDEAIKYLERLRFCESLQDSLSSAKAVGFVRGDLFANSDFILDTSTIEPPSESSWLKVGGILSGSQHAACCSSLPPHLPPSPSASHTLRPSYSASQSPGPTDSGRGSHASQTTGFPNSDHDERWPVKVTIHSIDYGGMTLSGTMEAFNVPDKTSPTKESSITTFLEGDIIDFNIHTLETKSWDATLRVDGTYWRKLEPFKNLTDDEMVRALTSKKWFEEELSKKWILMRWKGRLCKPPRGPFWS